MGKRVGIAAGCLLLAALSLLIAAAPTTDPWGWIVWGREVAGLELDTNSGGAPAWKPLPVLFTTVFSLAGDAAPSLWIVASRAGGLAALVLAFLLGRRMAGPVAGVLAAAALLLLHDWVRGLMHAYSEGMVVALLLGAVELHLRERRTAAFGLLCLAGLGRPEVWPFLGIYALWLWRREPGRRAHLAGGLAAVPLLWFGGDLWGSGNAFHGGETASSLTRDVGRTPTETLSTALAGGVIALVPLALCGVALLWRRRPLVLWLGGVALSWTAMLLVLMEAGYPASPRFFTPPFAALALLAAAGAVELARAALRALSRARARPAAARWGLSGAVAVGVALVLGVAATSLALGRASALPAHLQEASDRARAQAELRRAARELPSPPNRVLTPRKMSWNHGALAWELGLPLRRAEWLHTARAVGQGAVVVFEGRAPRRMANSLRPLGRRGRWRLYRLERRSGTRTASARLPSAR